MYYFQPHRLVQNWIHQVELMESFPRWLVWGLVQHHKLVWTTMWNCFNLGVWNSNHRNYSRFPIKKHLSKFYLDLPIPRYKNFPLVTYLRLDYGGGWNPGLEESYLLKYNNFEAEIHTKGTKIFHIQLVQVLALDTSPKSIYSEKSKATRFFLLRFSSMKP